MSNQEIVVRLKKYQELYDKLSVKIEKLYEFEKEFKSFSEELNELETYYHGDWLDDIDTIKDNVKIGEFSITSEDAIWNLLSDHYEYNKELLKVLADELNK